MKPPNDPNSHSRLSAACAPSHGGRAGIILATSVPAGATARLVPGSASHCARVR
jgi:hypothetical protein